MIAFALENQPRQNHPIFNTVETTANTSDVLKVDVTAAEKCGGVASAFKMQTSS